MFDSDDIPYFMRRKTIFVDPESAHSGEATTLGSVYLYLAHAALGYLQGLPVDYPFECRMITTLTVSTLVLYFFQRLIGRRIGRLGEIGSIGFIASCVQIGYYEQIGRIVAPR